MDSSAPWFALPPEGESSQALIEKLSRLSRIAIVGAGQMGLGIAEVCARAGLDVTVLDAEQAAVELARARLEDSLERALSRGKVDQAGRDAALERVVFSSDWGVLDGADAAVEAVVESEAVKRQVFGELDRRLPDAQFLASNTSSVPIMKLARSTGHPDRVLGLHFFNPVPVMDLVEVIPALSTATSTVTLAEGFVRDILQKTAIRAPDRAGFVVNALLIPYVLCAIRMFEAGPASRDEIDDGMVKGCHHPMGPLRLADLIGLDTVLAVSESLYEEFHEPFYSAPPLLRRMVEAGMLGRKTGSGFYGYRDAAQQLSAVAK
jgi:3-hydroxybutyryl-CoA dehydrogenase